MPTRKMDCGFELREKTNSQKVWRSTYIALLTAMGALAVFVIQTDDSTRKTGKPLLKTLEIQAHTSPLKTG